MTAPAHVLITLLGSCSLFSNRFMLKNADFGVPKKLSMAAWSIPGREEHSRIFELYLGLRPSEGNEHRGGNSHPTPIRLGGLYAKPTVNIIARSSGAFDEQTTGHKESQGRGDSSADKRSQACVQPCHDDPEPEQQ